jgi:hypothetical protein
MDLPLGEWQFWVVTTVAIGAGMLILKPLFRTRGAGCGRCDGGKAEKKRVSLTVSGRKVK